MDVRVEVVEDVSRLDALVDEVRTLLEEGAETPRVVHALRNLAHLADLLGSVLSRESVDLRSEEVQL